MCLCVCVHVCVSVCGGQGRGPAVGLCMELAGEEWGPGAITHGPAERGEVGLGVYTGVLGRRAVSQDLLGVT